MPRAALTTTCHCGAVRIEVSKAPSKLTACNCSVCRRYGSIWAYFQSSDVRYPRQRRALEFYDWGDRRLRFGRCRTCGCVMLWEPNARKRGESHRMGINVRNVEAPEAIARLPIRMLDGAATWRVLHTRAQPHLFRSPRPRSAKSRS